jgi:hypothetical protein
MLSLNKTLDTAISIESATARLTETILGNDDHDLAETLRTIASDVGLSHISYVRLSPDKDPICAYWLRSSPIHDFGSIDTL